MNVVCLCICVRACVCVCVAMMVWCGVVLAQNEIVIIL